MTAEKMSARSLGGARLAAVAALGVADRDVASRLVGVAGGLGLTTFGVKDARGVAVFALGVAGGF